MGYLNNSTITVDAILTKKGRELLARGQNEFNITQFALSDDEIDYDLYNPDHPLGTAFYGAAIENMPVIEALPDETQTMKYKLVTLPKGTGVIPVVTVGSTNITLDANQSDSIVPQTVNFQQGNQTYGYTAILSDSSVCSIVATTQGVGQQFATVPQFIGDSEAAQSVTVSGLTFSITGFEHLNESKSATILIIGNETGGRVTINVTVNQVSVLTQAPVGLIAQ